MAQTETATGERPRAGADPWGRRKWRTAALTILIGVGGAFMALGGLAMLIAGEVGGLFVGAFGLGLLSAVKLLWPYRHGEPRLERFEVPVRPEPERGIGFPIDRGRVRIARVAVVLFGVGCVAMFLADDRMVAKVTGLLLATLVVWLVVRAVRLGLAGKWLVALTPSGLFHITGRSGAFVPWDEIMSVDAARITSTAGHGVVVRHPFLGLRVRDPNRVAEWGRRNPYLRRATSVTDYDLDIHALDLDAELVLAAGQYFLAHPEHRSELTSEAALQRINRL